MTNTKAALLPAVVLLAACSDNSTMSLTQDDFPEAANAIDSQFLARNMTSVATLALSTEQTYAQLTNQNNLAASVVTFDKPISGSDLVLSDIATLANDECMGFSNGEAYDHFLNQQAVFGKRYTPGNELFTVHADSLYLTDLFLGSESSGPVEQSLGATLYSTDLTGTISGGDFAQFEQVSLPVVEPITDLSLSQFNPAYYSEGDISTWPAFTADTTLQWKAGSTTAQRIFKMMIIEYDPNAMTNAGETSSGAGRVITCETADDGSFSFSPAMREWMGNDFTGLFWTVKRQGWNIVRQDSTAVVAMHSVTLSEIEITQ